MPNPRRACARLFVIVATLLLGQALSLPEACALTPEQATYVGGDLTTIEKNIEFPSSTIVVQTARSGGASGAEPPEVTVLAGAAAASGGCGHGRLLILANFAKSTLIRL